MYCSSPINEASLVVHAPRLPRAVDVVVVGGGIVGISTALTLAERGDSVLVCEKGRVGGEQSSRNWGWIRQTGRDLDEHPLMLRSMRLWDEMHKRTGEKDLRFSRQGVLYLSEAEASLEQYEQYAEQLRFIGVDSFILRSDQIRQLLPSSLKTYKLGLHTPSDGRVEPWGAVPAIARAVERAGGVVKEQCAVQGIESTNGCVSRVITEHGPVDTERILLSGGVWTSLLANSVGIDIPQLCASGTVARVDTKKELVHGNVRDSELALCKRSDGAFNVALTDHQVHKIGPSTLRHFKPYREVLRNTFKDTRFKLHTKHHPDPWMRRSRDVSARPSPFERTRVLDPLVDPRVLSRMLERLHQRFDLETDVKVTHAWSGSIDTMPDFVPVLANCNSLSGLSIATGLSGHGFGLGPVAGEVMADLMSNKIVKYNLDRFRLDRFRDKIRVGPL